VVRQQLRPNRGLLLLLKRRKMKLKKILSGLDFFVIFKKLLKIKFLCRNRRLFSNLLVGTLRQFQKEEKTVGVKGHAQV
jgi:hypothetical protein